MMFPMVAKEIAGQESPPMPGFLGAGPVFVVGHIPVLGIASMGQVGSEIEQLKQAEQGGDYVELEHGGCRYTAPLKQVEKHGTEEDLVPPNVMGHEACKPGPESGRAKIGIAFGPHMTVVPVVFGQHPAPGIEGKSPQAKSTYPTIERGIQAHRAVHRIMGRNEKSGKKKSLQGHSQVQPGILPGTHRSATLHQT